VSVKTVEQHGIMVLHRVRLILIRQRTQFSNAVRSHLAEFGIISAIGRVGLDRFLRSRPIRTRGPVANRPANSLYRARVQQSS
jgi:transposase